MKNFMNFIHIEWMRGGDYGTYIFRNKLFVLTTILFGEGLVKHENQEGEFADKKRQRMHDGSQSSM